MTIGTLPIGSIARSHNGSLIEFCADDEALAADEPASVVRGPQMNARALVVMKRDVAPHAG